jgi:hypothetical protein
MSESSPATPTPPQPGRLAGRDGAGAPSGWLKWLPGLQTVRHYPLAWLRHDVAAGLVLTTMLVPVGIAYAVASGVPGIYGLYATIIPLLAYALFGPSRILVLGPDSSLAALILAVVLPLSGRRPAARHRAGQHDGRGVGASLHPRGHRPSRLRHRTALQADPLRLHERHCADGTDQPAPQALRLLGRGRRSAAPDPGVRSGPSGWQDQRDRTAGRRRPPWH